MNPNSIANKAVEYGINYLQEVDGPLIPFSLYFEPNEDPRNSQLYYTRHNADTLELGLVSAHENVKATTDIPLYAIAWDGYVTVENTKWDAILIEVGQSEKEEGTIFAQRYELKNKGLIRKRMTRVAVGKVINTGTMKSKIFRK